MVDNKFYFEPEKMIVLVNFRNFIEFHEKETLEPYMLREIPKQKNIEEITKFEN